MRDALQRAWLRRGPLALLLLPLALLFGVLAALRRELYRMGWLRTQRVPVAVVVIGNVVAGGAGKTPVVMAVVEHLRRRNLQVGVIARGYGRQGSDCVEVTPMSSPASVGDEPLLVATRSRVPVFVAARRIDAARALLRAHPGTQAIVSDDGLQHLALARDVDICVFDERGVGNGWLLPAGPLREPWPRRVDLVVRPHTLPGIDGFGIRRRLASFAQRQDGTRRDLRSFAGAPCLAVAGIARPEAFFAMLHEAGIRPSATCALPDHHDYAAAPDVPAGHEVLCTEKDAVKLWRSVPGAWAVPLEVELDAAFWSALDRLLKRRLSSTDGPQTA
ncbi:MAG TPA: tetraacyldisaccharide 4'-kinase [Ramlibacter sp.]|nr:tetraacyldisaccharide 4'-kinase [Ramlibacter sp.]